MKPISQIKISKMGEGVNKQSGITTNAGSTPAHKIGLQSEDVRKSTRLKQKLPSYDLAKGLRLDIGSINKRTPSEIPDCIKEAPRSFRGGHKRNTGGYMSVRVNDYNIKLPKAISEFDTYDRNDRSIGNDQQSEDEPGLAKIQFEIKQGVKLGPNFKNILKVYGSKKDQ